MTIGAHGHLGCGHEVSVSGCEPAEARLNAHIYIIMELILKPTLPRSPAVANLKTAVHLIVPKKPLRSVIRSSNSKFDDVFAALTEIVTGSGRYPLSLGHQLLICLPYH